MLLHHNFFSFLPNFLDYTALDLETTGLNPFTDDIIEVAAVKVRNGQIIDRFESFVYTPLEISELVSYLTGIHAKDLEQAPDFVALASKLETFIGDDPLLGHNIFFDWSFLMKKNLQIKNNALYDTYTLSNILFPTLPSHSLETNTKYFGISHEDSHRAMGDVLAAHELWKKLMQTPFPITPEQRKKIEELHSRSRWPLLDFFLQERISSEHFLNLPQAKSYQATRIPGLSAPDTKEHTLFTITGADPADAAFSLISKKKTLLIAAYGHTLAKLEQVFPEAFFLRAPSAYFSEEKVQALDKKTLLTEAETTFLVKKILSPETLHKEGFVLSHPERELWKELCLLPQEKNNPASHYQQALQKAMASPLLIMSHAQALAEPELLKSFERLLVLEPHLLEDSATTVFGKTLRLEDWMTQSSDAAWQKAGKRLFESVTRLGNQLVPSSPFPEHVILTAQITSSNEFVRLKSDLLQIQEESPAEEKQYLKWYQAFFQSFDPSWVRWFTIDPKWGVSLQLAPLSVKSLLDKHLFQKIPCTAISTTGPNISVFAQFLTQNVTKDFPITTVLPDVDLLKGSKKLGDHAAIISYLLEEIPRLSGKIGVIFSSKSTLKRYFFDLFKKLPEDMLLIGEEVSGGIGKLQDRYTSSAHPSKAIFLTYRNLRVFPPEVLDFDHIVLVSLPFDPPGNPVHQARSAQVPNAFLDYALPKAKQNLLEIVSTFTKRTASRKLYFLDRRVQEQRYGEEFLQLLTSPSS